MFYRYGQSLNTATGALVLGAAKHWNSYMQQVSGAPVKFAALVFCEEFNGASQVSGEKALAEGQWSGP
jgi:hypothetical protein